MKEKFAFILSYGSEVYDSLEVGDCIKLVLDDENPYDNGAVKGVLIDDSSTNSSTIGFLCTNTLKDLEGDISGAYEYRDFLKENQDIDYCTLTFTEEKDLVKKSSSQKRFIGTLNEIYKEVKKEESLKLIVKAGVKHIGGPALILNIKEGKREDIQGATCSVTSL